MWWWSLFRNRFQPSTQVTSVFEKRISTNWSTTGWRRRHHRAAYYQTKLPQYLWYGDTVAATGVAVACLLVNNYLFLLNTRTIVVALTPCINENQKIECQIESRFDFKKMPCWGHVLTKRKIATSLKHLKWGLGRPTQTKSYEFYQVCHLCKIA